MKRKIFDILKRKEDCVLLVRYNVDHFLYKVRDIENDDIYIGTDHDKAVEVFENYDLNKVREERKKLFEEWLEEYAEA